MPDNCGYCGGLHYGTQPGEDACSSVTAAILIPETTPKDSAINRAPADLAYQCGLGNRSLSARYDIRIANLPPLRLTEIQWLDLKHAIQEHERNGFRDGWCRMGSVRIT